MAILLLWSQLLWKLLWFLFCVPFGNLSLKIIIIVWRDSCHFGWIEGDIDALVDEGITIQNRLLCSCIAKTREDNARVFARLMFKGMVKASLWLLTDNSRSSFLPLSVSVGDSTVLLKNTLLCPLLFLKLLLNRFLLHPVIFDCLDEHVINSIVLHVDYDGAAGPSGLDAHSWWCLCTSFQKVICAAHLLWLLGKQLQHNFVDPETLHNGLITMDKNPEVRLIGNFTPPDC